MRVFFNYAKKFIDYLGACILALIFALFCSGRVGYFVLSMLIAGPLLSLLFTFIASRILVVSSSLSQSIFDKGSSFNLKIRIKRPVILLPMMPYSMTYDFGNGIVLTDEGKDAGGMFSRELTREVTFMCRYAGGGSIALMDMNLTDFFGIMSFKVKNVDKTPHLYGIIPQIPQTGTDPGKLKLVMESADMSDKEQEMSLDTADNFGGFPGYDHREYVDGDPVKRINYKLSARKDELFVRLDEKQVYGSVEIVLDPKLPSELMNATDEMKAAAWQGEMEEKLGMAMSLLLNQFTVRFVYFRDSLRHEANLREPGACHELCKDLAYCMYE